MSVARQAILNAYRDPPHHPCRDAVGGAAALPPSSAAVPNDPPRDAADRGGAGLRLHRLPPSSSCAGIAAVLHGRALADVIAARLDQLAAGHAAVLDDRLGDIALPSAAMAYLVRAIEQQLPGDLALTDPEPDQVPATWLLDRTGFRPGDARANLVKAAALILAAIDRLDRRGAA